MEVVTYVIDITVVDKGKLEEAMKILRKSGIQQKDVELHVFDESITSIHTKAT